MSGRRCELGSAEWAAVVVACRETDDIRQRANLSLCCAAATNRADVDDDKHPTPLNPTRPDPTRVVTRPD